MSHFSYHASSGTQLLCDLQGGVVADGAVLIDPAICSHDRRFGPADLGRDGISNFFANHVCNEFCGRRGWLLPRNAARLYAAREGTLMA